jgi:NADPH:quinone reductase
MQMARVYLWRSSLSCLPGGKRVRIYSINLMRARHPAWFREDLGRLFELLANGAIRPRVARRISFDEVVEAHRSLEAGGLEGKLVLCPDLPRCNGGRPGASRTALQSRRPRQPCSRVGNPICAISECHRAEASAGRSDCTCEPCPALQTDAAEMS